MDYFTFGSGKKQLVILPGMSLRPVTPAGEAIASAYSAFAQDYTLWLFDRRTNIPEGYTVRQMAQDTAQVMGALGIERASLFGASQGGMIAQYIAIDCPQLVDKAILASTAACVEQERFRQFFTVQRDLALQNRINELAQHACQTMYCENTLSAYGDVLRASFSGATAEDRAHYAAMAQSILAFDSRGDLKTLACPSLVIGCEGDRVFGLEASLELARRINAQSYSYSAEYGHCVYDEAPDYRQRMLEFLAEN